MTLEVTKDSIDLGIITRDAAPMVAFYRDVVGLPFEGTVELPGLGTMHRLLAGSSVIKITEATPKADAVPGGLMGATGLRYWTISVPDVDAVAEKVRAAGHPLIVEPREARPGVRIAMVADPDGNWLEFLTVAAT
ncbi:MAG TPA: VOC family protein [Pseudomonadales bacterium]|nr:VOC family protein [Pseudomonadales bacterium]